MYIEDAFAKKKNIALAKWCKFPLVRWFECFSQCKFSQCFILVKALARVSPARVPFAFSTIAERSGDAGAIIQRVVCFLIWVWLFIQLILGIMEMENINARPKIQCVLLVTDDDDDDDIYSMCRESFVTVHQYCCMGARFHLSPHRISCPGVTMKDSDYHKGKPNVWRAT